MKLGKWRKEYVGDKWNFLGQAVNERAFSKQFEQCMKDIESYTWRGEKQGVIVN